MITFISHTDKTHKIPATEALYKFDKLDCAMATNILYPVMYQIAKKLDSTSKHICIKFANHDEFCWDEKKFFAEFYFIDKFVNKYARHISYDQDQYITLAGYLNGHNVSFTFWPSQDNGYHISCTYNPKIDSSSIDELVSEAEQSVRAMRYIHYWHFNRQWYMRFTNSKDRYVICGRNEDDIYSYVLQEDYLIKSSLDLTNHQIKEMLSAEYPECEFVKEVPYHEGSRWHGNKAGSRERNPYKKLHNRARSREKAPINIINKD